MVQRSFYLCLFGPREQLHQVVRLTADAVYRVAITPGRGRSLARSLHDPIHPPTEVGGQRSGLCGEEVEGMGTSQTAYIQQARSYTDRQGLSCW